MEKIRSWKDVDDREAMEKYLYHIENFYHSYFSQMAYSRPSGAPRCGDIGHEAI
jgi:hypothetical protein